MTAQEKAINKIAAMCDDLDKSDSIMEIKKCDKCLYEKLTELKEIINEKMLPV